MHEEKDIYIIGFWPDPETKCGHTKYLAMEAYYSLGRAYKANVQIVSELDEVMNLRTLPYVSVEGPNDLAQPLPEFEHPERAVYITGNNVYRRPSFYIPCDYCVQIPVADRTRQMYGFQAMAIVLHDRLMKHASL